MFLRLILVLVLSGLIAWASLWLVANPGAISIDWMGWHAETTMLVLLLFVLFLLLLITVVSSLFRFLFALGKWRSRALLARRVKDQEAGVAALTAALEAAAAGQIRDGRRLAGQASQLLNSRELARQLAALMPLPPAEVAETAANEGASASALAGISRRGPWWRRWLGPSGGRLASRLPAAPALPPPPSASQAGQPQEESSAGSEAPTEDARLDPDALAELAKACDWDGALALVRGQPGLPPKTAAKLGAALVLAKAQTLTEADPGMALALAKEALDASPRFLPAILLQARLTADRGQGDEALAILKEAWRRHPAYPLLERGAAPAAGEAPETRLKRLETLAAGAAEHPEGHLALGEAALHAKAWGRARRHLIASVKAQPSRKAYALLAQVEEEEGGDAAAASRWRHKASETLADYSWHCPRCEAALAAWTPACPSCQSLGEIAWAYAKISPPAALQSQDEGSGSSAEDAVAPLATGLTPAAV
jgi:HemY protein